MNISSRTAIYFVLNTLYIALMVYLLYAVWQEILPWPFLFGIYAAAAAPASDDEQLAQAA